MIINTTSWKLGVLDDSDVARDLQFRFAARSILASRSASLPRHTIIALGASGGLVLSLLLTFCFWRFCLRRRVDVAGWRHGTPASAPAPGDYYEYGYEPQVVHTSANPRSLWSPSQLEREIEFTGRNATAGLEGTSQNLTSSSTRETNLDQSQDISGKTFIALYQLELFETSRADFLGQ
jgi:hypothetical protein